MQLLPATKQLELHRDKLRNLIRRKSRKERLSGLYKLTHIPTDKFYIGSSNNLYARYAVHKSLFKNGKNFRKLQELYTGKPADWQFEVVQLVQEKNLAEHETKLIAAHINDKNNLNKFVDGRSGKRGKVTSTIGRHRIAASLLGKNLIDSTKQRPEHLTIISPDGTEYENVLSVKRFAQEHNLRQSTMNSVANGSVDQHSGWTIEGGNLPPVGYVYDTWPTERLREYYPEHVIIGPENEIYNEVFSLWHFEQKYNCKVVTKNRQFGASARLLGLDKYGRGYRLASVDTFKITFKDAVYNNILSIGKFCKTNNIRLQNFREYLRGPVKNKRQYNIQREMAGIRA